MDLLIGEKIKQIRRERDLTQDEVASALGISYQAISKWERNDGYPDITILPALANYFGITVDELIGMNEIAAQDRLNQINQQYEKNRVAKRHSENVKLMKDALKIYPNNALLLVQLSAALERIDGTDTERALYLQESIDVQERILRYCDDSEVRGAVLFNIADAYLRQGNNKKAEEYARKLPNFYKTRENALVAILSNDNERHDVAMQSIERIIWSLSRQLTVLAEIENDNEYYRKIVQIIEVIYNGNESDRIVSVKENAAAALNNR